MRSKFKKALSVMLLFLIAFSSAMPSTVYANTNKFKGKSSEYEDYQVENAYKVWSVFKTAGYSDYAAAGVIGNMVGESGLDATKIEALDAEANTVKDSKHKAVMKDWCGYVTGTLINAYANWGISETVSCKDGHVISQRASSNGRSLTMRGYLGDDQLFYPGVGLVQFTGPECTRMFHVADENNLDWWTADAQLLAIFIQEWKSDYTTEKTAIESETKIGDSTDESKVMQAMYNTKFKNASEASDMWMNGYEGASYSEQSKATRRSAAEYFYVLFHGDSGDAAYGVSILTKAGFPCKASSDEIRDVSIMSEYVSPNLIYPTNSGFAFDVDGTAEEYAESAATTILKSLSTYAETGATDGTDTKKYSLYDLFGSDIHWYRYLGERTVPIALYDHIYSGVTQDKTDKLVDLGETVYYESDTYLSCSVYSNRPTVLTVDNVNSGKTDPRVTISQTSIFNGYLYTSGSFFMAIAKNVVSIVTMAMSNKPIDAIHDLVSNITGSTVWDKVAKPLIMFLAGLAMCLFIISFVGEIRKYVVGQSSARQVLGRFAMGILCLGLSFALASNPGKFNDIVRDGATILDDFFNSVLTMAYTNDDVIGSTDGTKTTEAAIWKTAVFEPWCVGQFGDTYENLYTQYSDKDAKNKMDQSYATEDTIAALGDDEWTYSSATYTGDVAVPVGNNTFIRNWAAYLYSCGSRFHIDQAYLDGEKDVPASDDDITWPNCYTTAYDSSIAADTFRVIDAQLNISPQLYKSGAVLENYTGSNTGLNTKFASQGRLMLIYALILFVSFMPALMMKFYCLLKLFLALIQTMFACLIELARPGGELSKNFSKIWTTMVNLFINCLRIYILTILYTILVGQSFIQTIVFLILAIMVYSFTLDKGRQMITKAKTIAHHAKYLID